MSEKEEADPDYYNEVVRRQQQRIQDLETANQDVRSEMFDLQEQLRSNKAALERKEAECRALKKRNLAIVTGKLNLVWTGDFAAEAAADSDEQKKLADRDYDLLHNLCHERGEEIRQLKEKIDCLREQTKEAAKKYLAEERRRIEAENREDDILEQLDELRKAHNVYVSELARYKIRDQSAQLQQATEAAQSPDERGAYSHQISFKTSLVMATVVAACLAVVVVTVYLLYRVFGAT